MHNSPKNEIFKNSYFVLSDQVESTKKIWLVGDVFLKDVYYTLRAMKTPGDKKSSEHDIYLHQMYDVEEFYSDNFREEDAMSRIINSLVKALNKHNYMPRMIIFFIDHEFIQLINYSGSGISLLMGKCLYWMISRIMFEIDKKEGSPEIQETWSSH